MHQRAVAFASHGFDHAQRGERVDEARGALRRGRSFGQHQAVLRLDASVLRVHGSAKDGHRLAEQRLRRVGRSCSTTTPAPSLPTGMDSFTRAVMLVMA